MMKHRAFPLLFLASLIALSPVSALADPADPVKVFGRWKDSREKTIQLELGLEIEEHGFRVYKDSLKVTFPHHVATIDELPPGEKRQDPLSHGVKEVYADRVTWPVELERNPHAGRDEVVEVRFTYRACNDITCHFPKTKTLKLSAKHPNAQARIMRTGHHGPTT